MVAQERLEHLAPAMPFRSAEDLIPLGIVLDALRGLRDEVT